MACLTGRARTVQSTERDVAILALQALFPWTERYGTYENLGEMKRGGKNVAGALLQGCSLFYLTNERNLGWVLCGLWSEARSRRRSTAVV